MWNPIDFKKSYRSTEKIIINKEMLENAQYGEENKLNPIIIKKKLLIVLKITDNIKQVHFSYY